MGTSASHPSPSTINWHAVARGYERDDIPVERIAQELWRAAQSEPNANWSALLSSPIIATCFDIAVHGDDPVTAVRSATREIVRTRQSSIAADIAKHAVLRSVGATNRAETFVGTLFSEASNYLVSRDLSSYVGPTFRNQTVAQAIQFKKELSGRVAEVVRQAAPVPSTRDPQAWQAYVHRVAVELAGRT